MTDQTIAALIEADRACAATPHAALLAQILDCRVPKNEREHAAAREIERLRAEIAECMKDAERYRKVRDADWSKLSRDTLMHLSANAFDQIVDDKPWPAIAQQDKKEDANG